MQRSGRVQRRVGPGPAAAPVMKVRSQLVRGLSGLRRTGLTRCWPSAGLEVSGRKAADGAVPCHSTRPSVGLRGRRSL